MNGKTLNWLPVVLTGFILLAGCGDNTSDPLPSTAFNPPQNLKALSLTESSIRVDWTASTSASDTTFAGYVISWGTRSDTLPTSTFSYVIDSLLPGELSVSLRSRRINGQGSDAAIVRWAPAARFDAGMTLREYYIQEPGRLSGLDVGGQQSDPLAMAVEGGNPTVGQRMDIYLFGGEGEIEQPLTLRSANLFLGSWNSSFFSTVSHSSTSLDYPLSSFPVATSFTENAVQIQDNRVYYLRVVGDQGSVNYARIHVRVVPGGGQRNRSIEVKISLQRAPGLIYAMNAIETTTVSPFRHGV